jgi:hypothetical protein
MRTVKPVLIVIVLSVVTTTARDIPAPQPYQDADGYQIYSLLLSQEESYGLGEVLLINEVTIDGALSRKCLTPETGKQFSDAIAASYRVSAKRFRLLPHFQIKQPYKLYGPNTVVEPSAPTITMSAVGFNGAKTKAVVFIMSNSGGLGGRGRWHLLQKVRGKWTEVPGVTCTLDS